MSDAVIVVVPAIVHGTVSPATLRALVWALSIAAALLLVTITAWGWMGFTDWKRRRR